MQNLLRALKGVLIVAAFALASPAGAIPIPVGTTSADDLIINFDIGSTAPSPPYSAIHVIFSISGMVAGQSISFDGFGGSNGTGLLGSATFGPITSLNIGLTNAAYLDGVLSIGVRLDSGTAELTGIAGSALNAAGAPVTFTGSAVPEPATLALLGLGLSGLALTRRRKPR